MRNLAILVLLTTVIVSVSVSAQYLPGQSIWNQTSDPSSEIDDAYALTIDSSGVYVVGSDATYSCGLLGWTYNCQWRIEKRNLVNGSLIWNQTNNPSGNNDVPYAVTADNSGLYIVGKDVASVPGEQWRMEKRNLQNGSLIWQQTSHPSNGNDVALGVAVDSTGIYVAGIDQSPSPFNSQWRIEKRMLGNGSLIWSTVSDPDTGYDTPYGLAVDNTGVYIIGTGGLSSCSWASGGYDCQWRIEKRSLVNGGLIWSQSTNPSNAEDKPFAISLDPSGIYIVGIDSSLGGYDYQWRIEKRSLQNGSLLWNQTSNPSNWVDWAYGVAVDSTGVYIVGGNPWRIEKRTLGDGQLLWSESVVNNPGAHGVAVDSGGIYITGTEWLIGGWRIEKRDRGIYPVITTQYVAPGVIGHFLSDQFTVVGGLPPYSWSLVNGTLATGMNFYSNGILNGTPLNAGNFTFTVVVTDSALNTASKNYTKEIFVTLPPSQLHISKVGTTAVPGRDIDYYIAVQNLGNFPIQNILVDEFIDTSHFSQPLTSGGIMYWNSSLPWNILSWNITSLAPQETRILSYSTNLNAATPIGSQVIGGPACANFVPYLDPITSQIGVWTPLNQSSYTIAGGWHGGLWKGGFNCLRPTFNSSAGFAAPHYALDLQATPGQQVFAIAPGHVIFAGWQDDATGCTIGIRHNVGLGYDYSWYSHLQEGNGYCGMAIPQQPNCTFLVNLSQQIINITQPIAYVGCSGTGGIVGAHLHFAYGQGSPSNFINPCLGIPNITNQQDCYCWNGGKCTQYEQYVTQPVDPNEKEVIAEKFIKTNQQLIYPIHFENIGNTSAQNIFVNDTLDQDLNFSTLYVLARNGSSLVLAPNSQVQLFKQEKNRTVTLGNITINISVNETWTARFNSGTVYWDLVNIDLPPNATTTIFSMLKPKNNLVSSTEIKNNATIRFEIFTPIITNTTLNIIDDEPPNCMMQGLPSIAPSQNLTLFWNGTDPIGEIDRYSVFVSENGGGYTSYLTTSAKNGSFFGERGISYSFICIASDTAGNIELQSPAAEVSTYIPLPSLMILGVPSIGNTVTVSLNEPLKPFSPYLAGLSFGKDQGIPLGDGRTIPLNLDDLLLLSLDPVYGPLSGWSNAIGTLNGEGRSNITLIIPNYTQIIGLTVYSGFVTIVPGMPLPAKIDSISPAVPITFVS